MLTIKILSDHKRNTSLNVEENILFVRHKTGLPVRKLGVLLPKMRF